MAIEGSSSTTVRSNVGSSFYLTAYFVENSTNTTNNTSNITCRAQMYPTTNGNRFDVTGAGTLRVYWHDNRENYDREIASNSFDELGYGTWSRTAEGTFNATHNDDGKLSGYVYATWTQGSSYGGYVPNSGSTNCGWTALTEIARKVSIKDVTGTYTDENFSPTVKWTNNGNRVDLKIELPDYAEYSWKRVSNKQGSSSYTWSLTQSDINDILSRMTDRNTTTVRFTVVTVIGGTDKFYDWLDRTFTIVNGQPTFTNYTFKDTNTTTVSITGNNQLMVQGKSSLQVNISTAQKAVAKKSATMSSYSMSCAGLVASVPYTTSAISQTLGSPTSSGSQNISVSARDSRGNTTTVNKSVTVIPYNVPQIYVSGQRVNNFEADTSFKFESNTAIAPVQVNGTRKNAIKSFKFRYKKAGATSWQAEENVSYTIANDGKITVATFTRTLDNNFQWAIQVEIKDKFDTVSTLDFTVDIGIPIFRIGLDGNCYNNEHRILTTADKPWVAGDINSNAITTAKLASKAVTDAKIDFSKVAVPVLAFKVNFKKQTYSNGYLVLQDLAVLFKHQSCSAVISSNKLRVDLTLPTSGKFIIDLSSYLWTGPNSWDYIILQQRINESQVSRAMAPKPNGAWAFVNTRVLSAIANGDKLEAYLNTNGNNFSDGNMSFADSYMLGVIYRVGNA